MPQAMARMFLMMAEISAVMIWLDKMGLNQSFCRVLMIFSPNCWFLVAMLVAVGVFWATSMAKLGPDRTARGFFGMISWQISLKSFSEACSRPLVQIIMLQFRCFICSKMIKTTFEGTTMKIFSAFWVSPAKSVLARRFGCNFTPFRAGWV